jgi:hypothetical protein
VRPRCGCPSEPTTKRANSSFGRLVVYSFGRLVAGFSSEALRPQGRKAEVRVTSEPTTKRANVGSTSEPTTKRANVGSTSEPTTKRANVDIDYKPFNILPMYM